MNVPSVTAAPRSLRRASGVAVAGSAVLVAAVHVLARAGGDDLLVTPPGTEAPSAVPLVVAIGAATVGAVVVGAVAWALARTPRPRPTFVGLALVGLLLSFGSPIAAASTTATALWLSAMHVAVAVVGIPVLARSLPAVRAR